MPSFLCKLAAFLPIFTLVPVLAHAQGTRQSQTFLPSPASSSGQLSFPVNVRSMLPPFTPPPTGTVTLYNGATAVGSPGTLTAGSGFTGATFAATFGTPDPVVATAASGAVWGDFNEDRAPDLLVYGTGSGTGGQPGLVVQTFLAKIPAGLPPTYTPVASQQLAFPLQIQTGQSLAVLDVDGDGHLDLLAGNTVAYGNGDGTFGRVAVLPALATGYNQTYAVDIDGDGKMDIVAVDTPPSTQTPGTVQYAFTVFHNAGGGNLTAMGPYPLAPSFAAGSSIFYNIFGLSFADVNGDRRIDVLSQSNAVPVGNAATGNILNVMLNLGTGFGAPKTIDTSTVPNLGFASTAFADLNNDGKQDLVFSYQAFGLDNNGVATLLGNGDGTYAAPVNFTIGTSGVTIGGALLPLLAQDDVNGDGNSDVVLGSGVLLLGNGTGTLTASTPLFTSTIAPGNAPPAYAIPGQPIPLGDSDTGGQVIFINLQSGADAVFQPNIGSYATLTALLAPGTYSLTAHYSGDATYAASVSSTINVTTVAVTPTVAVTSSANPSYVGQSVTFTATIAGLVIGSGGTVTFSNGSTMLGTAPLSNGSATYTTAFSSAGDQTITAAYGGDANDAAASGTISQSVMASPISFPTPPAGSTTLTGASGASASGSVTIDAVAGYSGALSLSCSGLPANASCSFTPQIPTITAPSGGYGIIVTLYAPAPVMGKVNDSATPPGAVEWCGFSVLGLLLMGRIRRSRVGRVCLVLAAGVFAGLTGCGGGSSSKSTTTETVTPPGTYTFQLNAATSPMDTGPASPMVSQTYTLIVQ